MTSSQTIRGGRRARRDGARISIGTWAFAFGPYAANPWSFERVCEYAATAGYDGVEINGFHPHPHPDDFLGEKGSESFGHLSPPTVLVFLGTLPTTGACPRSTFPLTCTRPR